MKRTKNTIYNVFRYMNSPEYMVTKHTSTKLLQTFSHLGYEFEVRQSKDDRAVFICIDGICHSKTGQAELLRKKLAENENWYLGLNWTGSDEEIPVLMQEKSEALEKYLHP